MHSALVGNNPVYWPQPQLLWIFHPDDTGLPEVPRLSLFSHAKPVKFAFSFSSAGIVPFIQRHTRSSCVTQTVSSSSFPRLFPHSHPLMGHLRQSWYHSSRILYTFSLCFILFCFVHWRRGPWFSFCILLAHTSQMRKITVLNDKQNPYWIVK